jgi:HEAT repeat protein
LIVALGDKDSAVRRQAAEALGKLRDKSAVPALSRAVSDADFAVRAAALESLQKVAPDQVEEALLQATKSKNDGVRAWAEERLPKPEPPPGGKLPPAVQALVYALRDENAEVRGKAAESLGKLEDKAVIKAVLGALVGALGDKEGVVRRKAAESLGKLGDKSAVRALMDRVADDVWVPVPPGPFLPAGPPTWDPDGAGKGAALDALKALAPERVPEALKDALKSKNKQVRAWAAVELGGFKEEGVVDALIPLLDDKDGTLRRLAAETLGKLGDKSAVPGLMKRVADDVWVPVPPGPFLPAGPPTWDPVGAGKGAALDALRKLDKDKVEEALLQAAKSKNPNVRQWALDQLGMPKDKK